MSMALRLVGLLAFVALVVAGCGVGTQVRSTFEEVTTACTEAFAEAAAVGDMEDSVEDLYPAIRACETLAEWTAASDAYPAALDGAPAALFAQNACASNESLAGEPLCIEVGAISS
jgi:hypothetical protein